jgi:hypothetical protein
LNTLAAIADRKAGFRSLGDTSADTTTSHGDTGNETLEDIGRSYNVSAAG